MSLVCRWRNQAVRLSSEKSVKFFYSGLNFFRNPAAYLFMRQKNTADAVIPRGDTHMALSIHTNYAALVSQNTLNKNNGALSTAMQRLGTGLRVNSAADDAAGLQIANRLTAQTRGMAVAQRNSQDAISMLQTADGALDEISSIAFRMKDLALQAANGTNNTEDLAALDAEFAELSDEVTRI